VHTADGDLAAVLRRSIEDLGALRIFDPDHPQRAVVAAGSPWFMALFGRDSLVTAGMVLPLDTGLAFGTLQTLADHQGRELDATTEEQPGRILHELRFGPANAFNSAGRTAYYGTADATPLFVWLVGELHRWGIPWPDLAGLLPAVHRAMRWLADFGDSDADGYVEYRTPNQHGLVNQGWKDSWDGISFADGRLPEAPIALAEVQAYHYAALQAAAELSDAAGDPTTAESYRTDAAQLKKRFNRDFWLDERGWFAIGLDRDKRPIDALASNMGHCLWAGIVDEDKALSVVRHLMSDQMFTGWGIRTLATSMARYNPMSYHNGSVWPHDTALCAAGLMRYGFVDEAQRVAVSLLDAAKSFSHRLPELFCGFDRAEFTAPVPYPAACSPQAWAAAAPISLLRTLLQLEPQLPSTVRCAPRVPKKLLPMRVSGLRLGAALVTIDVTDAKATISGLGDNIRVVVE
ncbi:MAG TPA: amylo-alpha-1,6-glucosidase, partial [Jatrophihabitantaceae bacterium]|nr:amylo-alpha-1,6-glucosidase [Jatrophihabitantaceae bacterium]